MRNPNNPRHKLDEGDVADIKKLYELKGWKVRWISTKYRVHHTSILARIKAHGWTRKVSTLEHKTPEVVAIYKMATKFPPNQKFKTFEEYIDSNYDHVKGQFQAQCKHPHLTVRCAVCGKVMGSEVNFHKHCDV